MNLPLINGLSEARSVTPEMMGIDSLLGMALMFREDPNVMRDIEREIVRRYDNNPEPVHDKALETFIWLKSVATR